MPTYPPCWVLKARIQKHRGKPLLFHDKCPGFFDVHYTTHGTYMYSFTSIRRTKQLWLSVLLKDTSAVTAARPGFEHTFWQHQNLSPMHYQTARPRHAIGTVE